MSNDVTFQPHVWQSKADAEAGRGYKPHVQISRNGHKIEWIDALTALCMVGIQTLTDAAVTAIQAAEKLNTEQNLLPPQDQYATPTELVIKDSYVGNLPKTPSKRKGGGRSRGKTTPSAQAKDAAYAALQAEMQAMRQQYASLVNQTPATPAPTPQPAATQPEAHVTENDVQAAMNFYSTDSPLAAALANSRQMGTKRK